MGSGICVRMCACAYDRGYALGTLLIEAMAFDIFFNIFLVIALFLRRLL